MARNNLFFKIYFPIFAYLAYSLIVIFTIGFLNDNPLLYRNLITNLGMELDGVNLFKGKMFLIAFLIVTLYIPFYGLGEIKNHLIPDTFDISTNTEGFQKRILIYFAVLVIVMTVVIVLTIRAITSAGFKEYLELSGYSLGIELVTSLMFVLYLIVAIVTVMGIIWFDSKVFTSQNTRTGFNTAENERPASR